MQISLKWVNELVNIKNVQLEYLIEKLTLGGFEVENVFEINEKKENQITLDISATTNRSDSLSIQGISSEISALLNESIYISSYSEKIQSWKENLQNFAKTIPTDKKCSVFLAVTIENLRNRSVPNWIKKKLINSGLTPLNNLLDFQNYVLLETGYPFAFYDFEKLCSKLQTSEFDLSLVEAKNDQEFLVPNNCQYKLDNSILTVNANKVPISIAGLVENHAFSYDENTTALLIEGSIFNAVKIRQQSRKLGLRTDRSARYEKSLKYTYLIEAFYRLILLLRISNPDLRCKFHTINQTSEENLNPILLKYQTICESLGQIENDSENNFSYIPPNLINDYLTRLRFEFLYNEAEEIWEVRVPQLRSEDISREIDLVEEIGRLHGFNNFLTTLPKIKTIGIEDSSYKSRKKITSCLLSLGFNELIHYSLVNETTIVANEIKLLNPLLSDCSNLRSTLLPNLIKSLEQNLKQGNLFLEGFEYGHVFLADQNQKFVEKEYVAGIFGGIKTKLNWSDSEIGLGWFEAKGRIEQLFKQLNLVVDWQTHSLDSINKLLHPYRQAELFLQNGIRLGVFGQIHPILSNQFNLAFETYLFEFDIEVIQNQLQKNLLSVYKEYSLYPKITKDLSFIIDQNISFKDIKNILYLNGTKFLSEISLLDEYRGKSIPENQTSLCLQLTFKSKEKTLQNKEIEDIVKDLQLLLEKKFNATIRK